MADHKQIPGVAANFGPWLQQTLTVLGESQLRDGWTGDMYEHYIAGAAPEDAAKAYREERS